LTRFVKNSLAIFAIALIAALPSAAKTTYKSKATAAAAQIDAKSPSKAKKKRNHASAKPSRAKTKTRKPNKCKFFSGQSRPDTSQKTLWQSESARKYRIPRYWQLCSRLPCRCKGFAHNR
jgi:hypothetical protein